MSSVDPNFRINGTICAPVTPFRADGELMLEAMPAYVKYLDTHGMDGVFISGTLGEGMSCTVEERKRVAECWMKSITTTKRLKTVISHVGTANLMDTMELAAHAEKIRVHAIAVVAPSYHKPANEEQLVEYMAKVAAAAPNTPFYLYDINFITGIYNLKNTRFFELAADRIPNLRGGKISSMELPALYDCTKVCGGRFQMMIGTDEQFITALSLGITVPVLNSLIGDLYNRLKAAFDRGDREAALKEQSLARELIKLRAKHGADGAPMVKAQMRCLGVDLGSVRLPMTNMPQEKEKALCEDLRKLGML